jgi:hypothetical protein
MKWLSEAAAASSSMKMRDHPSGVQQPTLFFLKLLLQVPDFFYDIKLWLLSQNQTTPSCAQQTVVNINMRHMH